MPDLGVALHPKSISTPIRRGVEILLRLSYQRIGGKTEHFLRAVSDFATSTHMSSGFSYTSSIAKTLCIWAFEKIVKSVLFEKSRIIVKLGVLSRFYREMSLTIIRLLLVATSLTWNFVILSSPHKFIGHKIHEVIVVRARARVRAQTAVLGTQTNAEQQTENGKSWKRYCYSAQTFIADWPRLILLY